MSDKLAFKHKNSLTLKGVKTIPSKGRSKSFILKLRSLFRLLFLPVITCCASFCYWFILCPSLWFTYYQSDVSKHWPIMWPLLFWVTAILLWCFTVIILVIIWRFMETKSNINIQKKAYSSNNLIIPIYDTNKSQDIVNVKNVIDGMRPLKFDSDIIKRDTHAPASEEFTETVELHNTIDNSKLKVNKDSDLAPLMIHRGMSNDDVENTGQIKGKENDETIEEVDDSNSNTRGSSIKDYLTLVTVSPLAAKGTLELPLKIPMSPRDLFFIDMIKEADRLEKQKKSNNQNSDRFSYIISDNSIMEIKEIRDKNHRSDQKGTEMENVISKLEATTKFFI